jgi:hypothetical protein
MMCILLKEGSGIKPETVHDAELEKVALKEIAKGNF